MSIGIPSQDNCDADSPEEHALWALIHLPNVGGAPMVTHPDILRGWSKHLYELGFRHHPELQVKKFQKPAAGPQSQWNASTAWVPIDAPAPDTRVIPDIGSLTAAENAAMIAQYRAAGMIPDPTPDRDHAIELK
ncbi:phage gene 29 protein family protein [Nocardia iowensis]|uniref:DUF2744 domain-containing protein n=1 Tax=Nocardia iowensis TaxID=204891 RepID=A0ABX8RSH3_NOCIO|nr:DUF2744 domain-containing protein [Nocardia iowensis]QXN92563.1 DUF2744 domain-containing protein [Nocardia iowensis]